MKTVTFNRKVFVFREQRVQISFADIKVGEVFELQEADNTPAGVYVAAGKPYQTEDGVWTIEVKE